LDVKELSVDVRSSSVDFFAGKLESRLQDAGFRAAFRRVAIGFGMSMSVLNVVV
jgi:hypothetical protein